MLPQRQVAPLATAAVAWAANTATAVSLHGDSRDDVTIGAESATCAADDPCCVPYPKRG